MSIIGIVSMKGGVGKTTVAANLSCAMAEILGPTRVSVVDLDPQNALHWHLGLNTAVSDGVCKQSLSDGDWNQVIVPTPFGVRCLAYGEVTEPERVAFEDLLSAHPHWVGDQIRAAELDDDALVLIDSPPGSSVYLKQVFACADLVVIVLLADAASYATVPAMETWMAEMQALYPDARALYLLNQIDRTDLLNKDVADILRQRLGDSVIPVGVHADESVPEALAFQQPVLVYDAHGQASHDLALLAEFLIDTLNQ